MIFRIGYWLALAVWCCSSLAWSAPLRITVESAAEVQGATITIGDIANIQGGEPETIAIIKPIVIGQSPAPGEERSLYSNYIDTRLKQHGLKPQNYSIQAPDRILVRRAFQHLESGDIESRVVQAIQKNMPWKPHQVSVRSIRGIRSVKLPPGHLTIDVLFPPNTDFLGSTPFTISFRVNGNIEQHMYGTALLNISWDLVTTARPLPRHHVITASDIRIKNFNLTRLPRQVFRNQGDIIGKRTRRPLRANTLIHAYEVEALPLIRKGDVIMIRVESPLLHITTIGEAIENGYRGETIRVKNLSSQREVHAVVVDPKTVRVPF